MSDTKERKHLYHAEATILSGLLRLPLAQQIKPQAHAVLPPTGGYFSQRTEDYRLEEVISIRSAHTHVAGNRSTKPGQGFTTLTTTVVEGLNVLEVLTADRVVGQTITEHPLDGYVPTVSFLGTRFENLRIAGHPVELTFDQNIFGAKPENDGPYTRDPGFISRVARQYDRIGERGDLPADLRERYNQLSSTLGKSPEVAECSLVSDATGAYPGYGFGHVIRIPDFGTITLGKLSLKHEDFGEHTGVPSRTTIQLTMIDLQLGCAVDGGVPIGTGSTNGMPDPGN